MDSLYHHGVLGMKWGIRRYQNKDGTLTPAGKARYEKDVQKNLQKKRKDRVDEEALKDPNRWVKEDLERKQQILSTGSKFVEQVQNLEKNSRAAPAKLDLSSMTDQELRERINREMLEKQYNNLFNENPATVSKGREYISSTLKVAGSILTLGSSALGIALAIKQLKE